MQRYRYSWRMGFFFCASIIFKLSVCDAAELEVLVKNPEGNPLADAVITLYAAQTTAPNVTAQPTATKDPTAIMDQVAQQFKPFVLPIMVGTQVRFPNSDNIRHHVYSFSPAKKFELPLYQGTPAAPVLFDKPGLVVLGCNIHDSMIAYVYVSDTPYFARSDSSGAAILMNIPIGKYSVRGWHPQLPQQKTVELGNISISQNQQLQHYALNIQAATPPPPVDDSSPLEDKFKSRGQNDY